MVEKSSQKAGSLRKSKEKGGEAGSATEGAESAVSPGQASHS